LWQKGEVLDPKTSTLVVKDSELNRLFNTCTEQIIWPLLRIGCHHESHVGHVVCGCTVSKLADEGPEPHKVRDLGDGSRKKLEIASLDGNFFGFHVVEKAKDTNSPAVALSTESEALCERAVEVQP
jgi:hypothetical protein